MRQSARSLRESRAEAMQKGKDYWLQAQQGHRAWHKECYMKADKLVDDKIAVIRIEHVDWIRTEEERKLYIDMVQLKLDTHVNKLRMWQQRMAEANKQFQDAEDKDQILLNVISPGYIMRRPFDQEQAKDQRLVTELSCINELMNIKFIDLVREGSMP